MVLAVTLKNLAPRMRCKTSAASIENIVFKLHYQLTVTLLLLFVVLVCARDYYGDHIKCINDKGVENSMINTYCFFMSTFTMPKYFDEKLLVDGKRAIAHPGVGPHTATDEIISYKYYQWVPFVLFIQATCFYMPHYIWKKMEGGRVKMLVDGLKFATLSQDQEKDLDCKTGKVPSKTSIKKKLDTITKDIILRLRVTRTWSTWLVAMEIANLLNIVAQIWANDILLKGHFIGMGASVIGFHDSNAKIYPLDPIFPKVTKCIFWKYGPSGSLQNQDALCVMGLNIIHEKIYTILWFWFLFLFIASVLAVMWRIASFFCFRLSLRYTEVMFWQASAGKLRRDDVIRVVNGCYYEDCLFLHYLSKNMEPQLFQALFALVAQELKNLEESHYNYPTQRKTKGDPQFVDSIGFKDEILPLKGGSCS